jgi:hypothetical protein
MASCSSCTWAAAETGSAPSWKTAQNSLWHTFIISSNSGTAQKSRIRRKASSKRPLYAVALRNSDPVRMAVFEVKPPLAAQTCWVSPVENHLRKSLARCCLSGEIWALMLMPCPPMEAARRETPAESIWAGELKKPVLSWKSGLSPGLAKRGKKAKKLQAMAARPDTNSVATSL